MCCRSLRAIALVALLVIAACGGDNGSKATTTTRQATTTTTAAATTTTSSGGPPTTSADQGAAQAALLNAADLPPGFTDGQWTHSTDPPPCAAKGSKSLDQQHPPLFVVGSLALDNAVPAALQEEIRVYSSPADAAQAFALGKEGFACSTGTAYNDDGTTSEVHISEPTDVASQLKLDTAVEWSVASDQFVATIVATQVHLIIVTFEFQSTPNADVRSLGDPLDTVNRGMLKIQNS